MEAYASVVRKTQDAMTWFVRARECKLLRLVTSSDLRESLLKLIAVHELHPENRSAFVHFAHPHGAASGGFSERAKELIAHHAERHKALAAEGIELAEFTVNAAAVTTPVEFAALLERFLQHIASFYDGLVVVLAPTRVDDAAQWGQAVRTLILSPALHRVRFVLVDLDVETPLPELPLRAAAQQTLHCRLDERQLEQEMNQLFDALTNAPASASGWARSGGAWPQGVTPPPRHVDRLRSSAAPNTPPLPALAGPVGIDVSRCVLLAAQALRRAEFERAIELQREACRLCRGQELARESLLLALILGTYLTQAGRQSEAVALYRQVAQDAQAGQHHELAAQALMALGATLLLQNACEPAARAYQDAAQIAERGKAELLAIESHRMAGQILFERGQTTGAAASWQSALRIATGIAPDSARLSSAPEAALALAAHYRTQRMTQQAAAMEALGQRLAAATSEPTLEARAC